jgi:hypothetical protein
MLFSFLSSLWGCRSNPSTTRQKPASAPLTVEVLEGRWVPAFHAPITMAGGGVPLAVADFNHDGRSDLAVFNGETISSTPDTQRGWTIWTVRTKANSSVSVRLSNGDGTFQESKSLRGIQGQYAGPLKTMDVNNDGHQDVVLSTASLNAQVKPGVFAITTFEHVWLGKGNGDFGKVTVTSKISQTPLWPYFGVASFPEADFDHNGFTDTVTITQHSNDVRVALDNGDGTSQVELYAAGKKTGFIAGGDFNGDGWTDLIVVNKATSASPKLSVLLNDGIW